MIKFFKVSPLLVGAILLSIQDTQAQKAPLDHSVYDSWENLGANSMTADGRIIYYTVSQQEGDSKLYVKDNKNKLLAQIDRTSNVQLTFKEQFLVALIKPSYAQTREARLKKKKADEMPKDTLGILNLRTFELTKIPAVKSFRLLGENADMLSYVAEIPALHVDSKVADTTTTPASTGRVANRPGSSSKTETKLFLYSFKNGVDTAFERIDTYSFNKKGDKMVFVRKAMDKDSLALDAGMYWYDLISRQSSKISGGKGDYRTITLDENEQQLVFMAYKGNEKAAVKPFSIYRYTFGSDTAKVLVDQKTTGIPAGWQIGTTGGLRFTKDGQKLFFGIAPVLPQKDTTLVEGDHAKVDIWHWKDDYLQTQQLVNLGRDRNKTYLAVIHPNQGGSVLQLADEKLPDTRVSSDGKNDYILGTTDFGRRIESQWGAGGAQDVYLISTSDGKRQLIRENFRGNISLSPQAKFVTFYDRGNGSWYLYNLADQSTKQLQANAQVSFANEDNDVPDDPSGYGQIGWNKNETEFYVYDKYDIWAFDVRSGQSRMITNGFGRENKITLRYQRLQKVGKAEGEEGIAGRFGGMFGSDQDAFDFTKPVLLSAFDHKTKMNGFYKSNPRAGRNPDLVLMAPYRFANLKINEKEDFYLYSKESYTESTDLYISKDLKSDLRLSATNPQQAKYNWGTAELFHWKTPKGYDAEGILYKPEDFDPTKKYPIIAYFYEKLSDGLYSYHAPSPTPSRLNISFFVSNGYLVFAPDISYEIGYPGRSAEEFINSGMQELGKLPWVNEKKMGIQGQSWGGYQVAHLITVNDMYAAAWAGAPVVNMTSAYGGIRWDSGMNRQFQYEKTQSRIGATLWEKPELYIENSPLFHFPKVNTPVAIMHNDEDGAVPWYQGIEMFTALRRLQKPVWLLNYNGDKHNLVQRQNRKDIQRRELEFFDHFLKDKPAAPWIETGVPAIMKGIDWGFSDKN